MKTIYSIIFLALYCVGFSQTAQLASANKKYDKYSYVDAIEIYEKVADKGYKSAELFKRLGNAYYFNGEIDKASKWYSDLFALNEEVEPEYYFRYSQCLKAQEKYDEANKYLAKFNSLTNDSRGEKYSKNKDYLRDIESNSGKYTVEETNLNTEFSDFGPSFFGNFIVFSSSREDGAVSSKINKWTNQNNRDLYVAEMQDSKNFSEAKNLSDEINTKFNESTPVFTNDGKTVYFTRNNFNDGKKGKDEDKSTLLKIYKAELVEGKWDNITELPFNSDEYSCAHPSLSSDEKTMYFASNMPGGLGSSDIYKVTINNGSFGSPENLGNTINTEGRDTFPFITEDNTLYFASDGQLGLGGLDIFESKFTDGNFQKPINLAKPINSSMDDFAFIINKDKIGYFSSNRDGGKGFDDIYTFSVCQQKLKGLISDIDTNEILPGSKVELFDEDMNKIDETTANEAAEYYFENVDCNSKYIVRASKEDYDTNEQQVATPKENGETELNIALKRNKFPVTEGTDLAKIFDISIIYFDLDKWNIRPDAAKDLQKIVEVMKDYPNMHVNIRSHTDSRQTHRYNEILSDRRAKSTLEFMVKNGIERERLTAKGYGETELVNGCSDGVPCSEEEHQKNRRSEFIVMKMD
ncbi:OmpA family protein [Flavobacterium okayamense]|uniref:Cell envelope biogenesis protein OmpA n=1 Tax=Flavobacterium okayamense TaxID=2830782 RepID=A0ABN6HXD3_9FLAO|nr:OmpA family protein [Flavobacterium okayamense]BCY29068.1 cell envelope biogenesis protein OmpA [Flavobacterium okayamense]